MNTYLELKKISKSFSGVEVLHEVSFALRPGEVHALLGENGAGKSTLVKVITGVHQPDGGRDLPGWRACPFFSDPRESRQAGIAAIYQELSLFPDLDVAENIFVGRQPTTRGGRIDWRKLYAEAGKLLDFAGCASRSEAKSPQPEHRPAADGRDRPRVFDQCPHPDHGRADLLAHAERSGRSVPPGAPLARGGHGHHFYLPPPGRIVRAG